MRGLPSFQVGRVISIVCRVFIVYLRVCGGGGALKHGDITCHVPLVREVDVASTSNTGKAVEALANSHRSVFKFFFHATSHRFYLVVV